MDDLTINFKSVKTEIEIKEILKKAIISLQEKGYNPIDQIIGYLMTGEPSYIPRHNNLRNEIKSIERDQILEILLRDYLKDYLHD